ncbi:MAG TPA: hypothetical protein VG651_18875 [Stellaceae bacterium]|nr:hypothetical protein [Stellaceae bacterium]
MPLDGSYLANEPYRIVEIPDRPVAVAPPQRRQIKWFRIFLATFALWLVCWTSEVFFHNRGIFTLVFGAPTLLRENDIARSILYGRDAHKLEFTVAGRHYTVISPGHPLTAEEQTALLHYAARNNLPLWAADGQFAVDP